MNDLACFESLKPYVNRKFVPADLDLGDWNQIAPWFDRLDARAEKLDSVKALEEWLLDSGELLAAVSEEGSRRHVSMTCQTDDPEREKRYLHYIEHISPQLKPRMFKLAQLFMSCPHRTKLPRERYFVLERSLKNDVEMFREENVPLETELARLSQQYQKISGAMTVQFQGREMTLAQLGRFLEEPDRSLRQQAWEKSVARRLLDRDKIDELFDKMLKLRVRMADNAGFANYRDYVFKNRERFDYTPEDCTQFHKAVETHVVPLAREMEARRARQMRLRVKSTGSGAAMQDTLRPWDLAVDPKAQPPLKPFDGVESFVSKTQAIIDKLDPDLAAGFRLMRDNKLLDLDNRKGKAPGGYMCTMDEARMPFIFMNAVGVQRDVVTLLHEAGHAFHSLATQDEPLLAYRSSPIEFAEVASMGMELLGIKHIGEFYGEADARRARREHLEGIIKIFPWIATVDAFQHWLYLHPEHTRSERQAAWLGLMNRFGGVEDWSGHEEARAHWWHRQLHIFQFPFYYIEYGIAQLGALQVWQQARRDSMKALKAYRGALALGGTKPLPELFSAAGLKFDFSDATIGSLISDVREELGHLSNDK